MPPIVAVNSEEAGGEGRPWIKKLSPSEAKRERAIANKEKQKKEMEGVKGVAVAAFARVGPFEFTDFPLGKSPK